MDNQRPIRSNDDDNDDHLLTHADSPVSRLPHVLVIEEVDPVLVRAANTVEGEEHGLTALVLVEVSLDIHINRSDVLKVDDMLTQLGLHIFCVTHDSANDINVSATARMSRMFPSILITEATFAVKSKITE